METELQIPMRDIQPAETASRELQDEATCVDGVTEEFLNRTPVYFEPRRLGPKIPFLVPFDGTHLALFRFIAQLQVKLAGDAVCFPSVQVRLAYSVSLLKGYVIDQLSPCLNPTGTNLRDAADLGRTLTLGFDDPDRVGTTKWELRRPRQKNRDIAAYLKERKEITI
jgi:hypothetical protein